MIVALAAVTFAGVVSPAQASFDRQPIAAETVNWTQGRCNAAGDCLLVCIFDEVPMGVAPFGDDVDVDIQRHECSVDAHEIECRHARFFACLAQCHFIDLPLAVGMPAKLEPAVEFAMMRQ
jgi:hypothetical protein